MLLPWRHRHMPKIVEWRSQIQYLQSKIKELESQQNEKQLQEQQFQTQESTQQQTKEADEQLQPESSGLITEPFEQKQHLNEQSENESRLQE